MARLGRGRGRFVAFAVVFHLVYIYSIFDIYFVSPIVHGMQAYQVDRPPGARAPANRLVLFVGDGLRADKAFQSFPDPSPPEGTEPDATPRPLATFLRSRVLSHGTFGVSHTRVPTESRPGHVALIAGLYEDVSSVTTGWKLNPVDFDSVFNRSRHTWSWGSPDILPMFKEGAVPGRIDADTYDADLEDYSQDATCLDTWVFDKVKDLFASAKHNATLNAALREDKTVFFLHLLGLDTTGHAHRPFSKEYLHNVKIVDRGVAEITRLIDDFYGDDRTAFIFTADHGMSDWGSHGDGHPDNTRTPLIAWGSGVARPKVFKEGTAPGHEDGFSSDWGLDHIQRHDVNQADVAALMAYLVGLEFPVNSVGELPLSYLSASLAEKASAALVNAREVLEMYRVKEARKAATAFRYQPYPPFAAESESIADRLAAIESAINRGEHHEAINQCSEVLHLALQGLRYLQTYDWLFLRALITLGYLGWITYALTTVVDLHVLHGASTTDRPISSKFVSISILAGLYAFFFMEQSPVTYYAYGFFPVLFWEQVYARRQALGVGVKILFDHVRGFQGYISFAIQAVAFIAILEILVQSYFDRIFLTYLYVLGAFWPFSYGISFLKKNKLLLSTWMAGCLILSTFTLLPAIKTEDADTITTGGLFMATAGALYLFFENRITLGSVSTSLSRRSSTISRTIMGAQVGITILTIIVTRSSVASLQAKHGLPLGNQVVGWFVLITSLVLPFIHKISPNNDYLHRLVVMFLAFSPSFILLTISYEGLFYFFFCVTLLTWVRLEHAIYTNGLGRQPAVPQVQTSYPSSKSSSTLVTSTNPPGSTDLSRRTTFRSLTLSDIRISLFTLFFLQSAFFSTGNIASVSSFSLEAVYRLIPVFDPFSQGALLVLKLIIPFAMMSANLGILNHRLGLQSSALFMVLMSVGDFMTLNFFFMVRDEGSWLEIGTGISHFVIGSLLGIFLAGLEAISEVLIQGVEVEGFEERLKSRGGVDVVQGGLFGQDQQHTNGRMAIGEKKEELHVNGAANGNVVKKRTVAAK